MTYTHTADAREAKATPVELTIPVPGVTDHGIRIVHDLHDQPRNVLHEVSIEDGSDDAEAYLADAGYRYRCGWIRKSDGRQMWTHTKHFDLTVLNW